MALGSNRDYKTTDQRARKQLARHAELMKQFMNAGHDRETASKLALEEMERRAK
jgi:hypothetical protein